MINDDTQLRPLKDYLEALNVPLPAEMTPTERIESLIYEAKQELKRRDDELASSKGRAHDLEIEIARLQGRNEAMQKVIEILKTP